MADSHRWTFKSRLRARALGWRRSPSPTPAGGRASRATITGRSTASVRASYSRGRPRAGSVSHVRPARRRRRDLRCHLPRHPSPLSGARTAPSAARPDRGAWRKGQVVRGGQGYRLSRHCPRLRPLVRCGASHAGAGRAGLPPGKDAEFSACAGRPRQPRRQLRLARRSACSARSASGRCARAGAESWLGASRRKAFWSRRWG